MSRQNIVFETRNPNNILNELVDDDREEVANAVTRILPVLNASEPREGEDNSNGLDDAADEVEEDATNNDRPKGGRLKATVSKKGGFLNLATTYHCFHQLDENNDEDEVFDVGIE